MQTTAKTLECINGCEKGSCLQVITKVQSVLATVAYILIYSGCTLLSVYKQRDDYLSASYLFLWIIPLTVGLVGIAYLIIVKKFRATMFYGIPTVVFAIGVALGAPSMFTRLVSLGLFCILLCAIWFQHFKTRQ